MAENKIRIESIEPIPFIFLSENYAAESNGGSVHTYNAGVGVVESTAYPIENIIDGNRATFCQMENLCLFYPAHAVIRFDLSDSLPSGAQIDFIVLENHDTIPLKQIRILSWSDSAYSTGFTEHTISWDEYQTIGSLTYYNFGTNPKVDGAFMGQLSNPPTNSKGVFKGMDGRNVIIMLKDPIVNPYVDIRFASPGRNNFGMDGTLEKGLYSNPVNETLVTTGGWSESQGSNDNHIKLSTTAGGADKSTRWFQFQMRPDQMYRFGWAQKVNLPAGNGGDFRIEVEYLSSAEASLGTDVLWNHVYPSASWVETTQLLNIPNGADRYSGSYDFYDNYHKIPDGTHFVKIRFFLEADGTSALEWSISDMQFYSQSIPSKVSELDMYTLNGGGSNPKIFQIAKYNDQSGDVRLRRIGMHSFKFSTSKKAGTPAHLQDIGGKAGANPMTVSEAVSGKTVMRDIHGVISSQFIPKSGTKQERTINIICGKEQRLAILDLYNSSTPFGLVDPQGDWSDYIITAASWTVEGAEDLNAPQDYLWSGVINLKEI